MANRKNETISYNLQAKADFSQLIKSLNSVYDEIRSKADKTDILSIDKTLSKMNELQAKLEQSIKNGFSSPKELKDFYKLMDNLNTDASNLSAKFQSIHVKGLQNELKEASKNLKEVEASYRKVRSEAENVIKSQLAGVKKSKEYSKSLVDAAGDAEKLKQVQEDITKEIEKQIKAEKDSQSLAKKSIDTEENNLNKQLKNRTSITQQTSLTSKNFKNADGSKISTDQWKLVRQAFSSAVEGSKKGSTALEKFAKQLKELGIEARSIDNVKNQFENLNNTVFNPSSSINTGIEQTKDNISKLNAELLKSQNSQANLEQNLNTVTGTLNSDETTAALQSVVTAENEVTNAIQRRDSAEDALEKNKTPERIDEINEKLKEQKERTEEVKDETTKMSESQQAFDNFTNSLQNSVKQILSITTSWRLFRQMVSQTFNDVKDLDKSFAQIAMVTNYEVSDMWDRYGEYAAMANKLGQSTQSVIEASGLYYQQGLDTAEVMTLTEETMKLATLAGLDFSEATSQMTAALRAFHMEMDQGAHITDVYAEVAAHAAVDVNGLSQAMSATASIANSAGMSFENTTAMLATMVEATQEAPKNLGTALKTVKIEWLSINLSNCGNSFRV